MKANHKEKYFKKKSQWLEELPEWCESCNKQGYFYTKEGDKEHLLECNSCGHLSAYVWCKKCEMGGGFIENLKKKPATWVCPDCQTTFRLGKSFYSQITKVYLEDDLSNEAQKKRQFYQKQKKNRTLDINFFISSISTNSLLLFFSVLAFLVFAFAPNTFYSFFPSTPIILLQEDALFLQVKIRTNYADYLLPIVLLCASLPLVYSPSVKIFGKNKFPAKKNQLWQALKKNFITYISTLTFLVVLFGYAYLLIDSGKTLLIDKQNHTLTVENSFSFQEVDFKTLQVCFQLLYLN